MATCSGIFMRDISGLIIFLMILVFGMKTFAQDNPVGYISIDCGSTELSIDPQTNLSWVDDDNYVVLGKNGQVQYPELVNSTFDNYQALRSFRYFSEEEMRNKYCYELPLPSNISFLLRAMFLHGDASELTLPIEFDVYVNATLWVTVNYTEGDDLLLPVVKESIFFSPIGGNTAYVCLVPNQGVPFISSLELRQLDPEGIMYYKSFLSRLHKQLFFTNMIRWNTGAATDSTTIRYPYDRYDRFWVPPVEEWIEYYGEFVTFPNIESPATWSTPGADMNSVPSKVMEDALLYNMTFYGHVELPNSVPGFFTYAILYFVLLNESSRNYTTTLSVTLDRGGNESFTISSEPSWQSFGYSSSANFTVVEVDVDTGNPSVLNALEIYQEDVFFPATTYAPYAAVVEIIKEALKLTDWQGDPCTPQPHDWIGCERAYFMPNWWYVITLTLSFSQYIGRLIEPQHISRLLEVNGNSTWGILHLSITNSNVDSDLFQSLLQDFLFAPDLISLDMSFNNISKFPEASWWIDLANHTNNVHNYTLSNLDFSYNELSRIPRFTDIPFSNQTAVLSFSGNKITGEFPNTTDFSNLENLQKLNLSYNYISGDIPESLSLQNLPSLEVLDISNNSFSGQFPSNFYFINDDRPFTLYADNNEFTGQLDLSSWYQSLLGASGASGVNATLSLKSSDTKFTQVFSLLKNKIDSIVPSTDEFQSVIQSLLSREDFNQSGVMLGGNPFCKNVKHFTQRYLCRSSLNETVHADVKENSKKAIIIGGVLGGFSLLLCFLFFTVVIWRLSKKVYVLKMVEQELANRKVQPPYYSYHDLKVATNNFHRDNHLGKGTFGAVYKGVLSDGTTIAIKRLFNSTKKQVLDDFLNEVVLITGIKHRNLVQLKGCCIENQERILVFEYAENDSIERALWGETPKTRLSWTDRFNICVGLASGLTYLHEELQPRIIHRDIKPANVLLDKNLNPKIADFGLAKPMLEEIDVHVTQNISGTRGYFAPEYLSEGILTTKVDVFSYGILVLEIVSGRKCFDPKLPPEDIQLKSRAQKLQRSGSTLELLDSTVQADYCEAEALKVINIALMCVQTDPELRPTMSEVETMLLEGQERMYDILCAASLRKEENTLSLERMYKSFKDRLGTETISSIFTGRGSQTSASGSSTTQLVQEAKPLLHGKQASDSNISMEFSSSDTKDGYRWTLGSMQDSLSERIKKESL